MNGLAVVNVELTSLCQKNCFCCGRRKLERDFPDQCNWGDMDFDLVKKISQQVPSGIILQFHSSGDPLLYPRLSEALSLFPNNIRCFNTNAIDLVEKSEEIIDNMESLTISVIQDDPLSDKQFEIVKRFIEIKGDRKPFLVYRLLGNVENVERWYKLPGIVVTRILHNPMGSFDYTKKVTIPEHGICLDLLTHLVIDRFGDVYPCVRFNPHKINRLGNLNQSSLEGLWNGELRKNLIQEHIKNNRKCNELCSKCDFYGCPTSL